MVDELSCMCTFESNKRLALEYTDIYMKQYFGCFILTILMG